MCRSSRKAVAEAMRVDWSKVGGVASVVSAVGTVVGTGLALWFYLHPVSGNGLSQTALEATKASVMDSDASHGTKVLIVFIVVLIASGFVQIWSYRRVRTKTQPTPLSASSVSSLATTAVDFNPDSFFAASYTSPLTEEAQNNVHAITMTRYQSLADRETFLLKMLGIGVVSYVYDLIWYVIFRSQLLLLYDLNTKLLTVDQAKWYFDAAAQQYSTEYNGITFEAWLMFLQGQLLVTQSGVNLAITVRGRDFLKYLVHWARSANQRRL